jgi:hypothetical protein
MKKHKYISKSETKRVFNVFNSFKKDITDTKSSSPEETVSPNEPVITMSSLGKLGRFGNQLFQYAFLKICSKNSGAKVECPPWIGQTLFGNYDAPISRRLPPAIEAEQVRETLFDAIPEFIPYLEKLAGASSSRVDSQSLENGIVNVDLWGFFQLHTKLLRPYQEYFRSLFQPTIDLKSALDDGLTNLRAKGKTIVGIHIRRGDFLSLPLASFTLPVPTKWYWEWLDTIWDELENPVLFICSDNIDSVINDFEKFSPVTSLDLNVKLPEKFQDLDIEFYIDYFMLSNCDVIAISNSIFSFTACMMNESGKMFVRPSWNFSTRFQEFDPWNSEPLLHIGGNRLNISKTFNEALYVTYVTQGIIGIIKFIFIGFPNSIKTRWSLRAYLGYQIQGILGVIKSFLYTCGWRSVWTSVSWKR